MYVQSFIISLLSFYFSFLVIFFFFFFFVYMLLFFFFFFFFSSRRRHTRCGRDWSSDVCSSDLRGSSVVPIRNLSTACAAWRPSRIAQMTSDWPRRMSPAANTFGTEVW